jgi:hypothetical protein
MSIGFKSWVCMSPTYASGGNGTVPLQEIPDGRLLGFLLRLKLNIVQGAGAAMIPGSFLYRLFDQVTLAVSGANYFRTTGRAQNFLNWLMLGCTPQMPQDVLAAAATYSRFVDCWLPFVDFQSTQPLDTAVNAALVRDTSININWGNEAALYGANTSTTVQSVRCLAFYARAKPDELGAEPLVEFTDWASQSALLPMNGAISHCFSYSESSDTLTDANFIDWSIYIDGTAVEPKVQSGEFIAKYDYYRAAGVTSLVTATGTGGEEILDEPGVAAAAGQGMAAIPFFPLLFPLGKRYAMTHLPMASSQLRIDWTGAVTTARFVTRRIQKNNKNRATELARKLGIVNPGQRKIGVQVAGAGRLSAEMASVLPMRIEMTADEIRARGGVA